MKALFILNDPPSGSERCYNALRLAGALLKREPDCTLTLFLMADAVAAAKAGQKTPNGYYNIPRMLKRVFGGNAQLLSAELVRTRARPLRQRIDGGRAAQFDGRAGRGHDRGR
jgi:uncharacterized protein involved in oxidation of intracellular sulfur